MDTLTRIRAFIDVVDAEGFSAAARKAGTLEGVAFQICARTGRRARRPPPQPHHRQFSLTEAGKTYYRSASEILKEIDELADLVRERTYRP